jgi:hypothetical protein
MKLYPGSATVSLPSDIEIFGGTLEAAAQAPTH